MMLKPVCSWLSRAGAWLLLAGWAPLGWAQARLDCQLGYGGSTQVVSSAPVNAADAYAVPSVDVAGRFRFKPVVVGQGTEVKHVSLYVYVETERQPILIQQATYLPPFSPATHSGPMGLTGRQHLYAGPMERELIYSCTLSGVVP